MMRKSISLLVLALAAAAVAAPIAQSSSTPKVDPLAVGYLIGQGLSPSEVKSWTVGACSHEVKAASCYAMLDRTSVAAGSYEGYKSSYPQLHQLRIVAAVPDPDLKSSSSQLHSLTVDPLAVSYLTGQGLSPSEVKSWTVGACAQPVKDAACYAMFRSSAAATQIDRSIGFQWGDAGIGAGFSLGALLILGGAFAGLLISRKNRRRVAHA